MEGDLKEFPLRNDSSIGKLVGWGTSDHTVIDIAIAQDALAGRVNAEDLINLYHEKLYDHDIPDNGEARALWIYRLGGGPALLKSLQELPLDHHARHPIIEVAGAILPDETWFRNLAKTEIEPYSVNQLAESALERADFETIDILDQRMDEFYAHVSPQKMSEISFARMTIDEARLKYALREKLYPTTDYTPPPPTVGDDRRDQDTIRNENESYLTWSRRLDDRRAVERTKMANFVLTAVKNHDYQTLKRMRTESVAVNSLYGFPDPQIYTASEYNMIQAGIDALEGKADPPPVYEIETIAEARSSFARETARYVETPIEITLEGRTYKGIKPNIKNAYGNPAFWLSIRLGDLGDIETLSAALDHPHASLFVKKEAARQLVRLSRSKILRDWVRTKDIPPIYWKVINAYYNVTSRGDMDREVEVFEDYRTLAGLLSGYLPAYVSAILE